MTCIVRNTILIDTELAGKLPHFHYFQNELTPHDCFESYMV